MYQRSTVAQRFLLCLIASTVFNLANTLPLTGTIRRPQGPRTPMHEALPTKGVRLLGSNPLKSGESMQPNHPAGNAGLASVSTRLLLSSVPVVWGTYTCAVKFLYQSAAQPPPTVLFNFCSYFVALTTLLSIQCVQRVCYAPSSNVTSIDADTTTKKEQFNTWFAGAELGFYLFLGSNLQVAGIQRTSAACAAALVQLSAVIVPLMEAMVYRRMPSRRLWLASIFSVAGMSTFSGVFSPSVGVPSTYDGNAQVLGNVLMLGAASCYSVHILRLSALASRVGNSAGSVLRLAVAKSTTEVILAAGTVATYLLRQDEALCSWMAAFFGTLSSSAGLHGGIAALALSSLALVVLWNGAVVTAFPMWAQAFGQQRVGASEAAIIYATQPVWAVAFAALFLHEKTLGREMVGGALLIAAILLSIAPRGLKDPSAENCSSR